MKAKHDDNLIDVEFEVDSNRVGRTWSVGLADDGVVVFNGSLGTLALSGSFLVERRIADRVGSDTRVAVASNRDRPAMLRVDSTVTHRSPRRRGLAAAVSTMVEF